MDKSLLRATWVYFPSWKPTVCVPVLARHFAAKDSLACSKSLWRGRSTGHIFQLRRSSIKMKGFVPWWQAWAGRTESSDPVLGPDLNSCFCCLPPVNVYFGSTPPSPSSSLVFAYNGTKVCWSGGRQDDQKSSITLSYVAILGRPDLLKTLSQKSSWGLEKWLSG